MRFKIIDGGEYYSLFSVGICISNKLNNGDFDYYLLLDIQDAKELGKEIDLDFHHKYVGKISVVAPDKCKEYHNAAIDAEWSKDNKEWPIEKLVPALYDYGLSVTLYEKFGNNNRKLLSILKKKAKEIECLFGFYMDRKVNQIGNTGWDAISGNIGFKFLDE